MMVIMEEINKHEKPEKQVEKITFNCPVKLFKAIDDEIAKGRYGSKTDAILTALRAFFQKE